MKMCTDLELEYEYYSESDESVETPRPEDWYGYCS